jgi:hypothetical protein
VWSTGVTRCALGASVAPPLADRLVAGSSPRARVSARLVAPPPPAAGGGGDVIGTFNPYPMMGAPHVPTWPRGLPLEV